MLETLGRAAAMACALLWSVTAAATAMPAPDAAAYAARAAIEEPLLSPDGNRVVARVLIDGVARLAVYDVTRLGTPPAALTLPEHERLDWARWIGPSRLLVSMIRSGPEAQSRLLTIDTQSGQLRPLGEPHTAGLDDALLHVDRAGRFVLVAAAAEGSETPGVFRFDLASGERRMVVAPQPHVWEWFADSDGVVRAGIGGEGQRSWVLYRKQEGDRFSRSAGGLADPRSGIEQFLPVSGSDQGYALAATRDGRMALFAYDFRAAKLGKLIHDEPGADIEGFEAGRNGELLGVEATRDRTRFHWFDQVSADRQARIDVALPGRVNRIVSSSDDESRLLVLSESASDPGGFYLYADGHAALLAEVNPALHGVQGAETRAIHYRARDGLALNGYLTLPAGRDPRGLPLVVMPHGGPFARDRWEYDPWVQYLASRGYAVLQPNFRGSTGMGGALIAAGRGEWGRGMQDDIDDAVAWAAAEGFADPGRVCIMGASFGGYAAMWAAVRDPGKYRCAISFAGISDVQAQLDYDHRSFSERDYRAWKRRIQGDADSLDTLSPLRFVDRMTVPILIAHGGDDDVVPSDQSERLHRALEAIGRAHGYVAYPGQGHSLSDPADSADFLRRVEAFLAQYNPA